MASIEKLYGVVIGTLLSNTPLFAAEKRADSIEHRLRQKISQLLVRNE
jgi:tetrahydromethanopterin S-methyltransferase subunit G